MHFKLNVNSDFFFFTCIEKKGKKIAPISRTFLWFSINRSSGMVDVHHVLMKISGKKKREKKERKGKKALNARRSFELPFRSTNKLSVVKIH